MWRGFLRDIFLAEGHRLADLHPCIGPLSGDTATCGPRITYEESFHMKLTLFPRSWDSQALIFETCQYDHTWILEIEKAQYVGHATKSECAFPISC